MSNGFEIQLHTARSSTSLQIRMTGSNTSSNQEINTTLCYIGWSRCISVYKVTSRTAGVRFPLRVRFVSVCSAAPTGICGPLSFLYNGYVKKISLV
jgi:hypothetical protein